MTQAAVWMDQNEAKIFHVKEGGIDEAAIHAPHRHVRRHPIGAEGFHKNHPDDEKHFFQEIVKALAGLDDVLVLGPSMTKRRFMSYLHEHAPALEARIVAIEAVDHLTDRQLVAKVREHFATLRSAPAPTVG